MAVELHICGTRGSHPVIGSNFEKYGQETTCLVIKENDYALVLDGGTGLVNALPIIKDCTKIDFFLSHLHHDHIMGLIMIPNMFSKVKTTFYGNFSEWKKVRDNENNCATLLFPKNIWQNEFICVHEGQEYLLNDSFKVSFKKACHKDGALMIRIQKNDKTVCFTGDNEYFPNEGMEEWARDCDYLIFDGCYDPKHFMEHSGWGHSSWKKGCEVAKAGNVKTLIITHHSPDSTDAFLDTQEILAKEIHKDTTFAREGMCFHF